MSRSAFTYALYVRAMPDQIWSALTQRELIKRYWFGATLESEWTAGASWRMVLPDGRTSDEGEVIEAEPGRKLVLQWRHVMNPDLEVEGASRCAITLVADGAATKLSVLHEMERPGSRLIAAVSDGWPRILSNLKSVVETGEAALKSG
jgi:uncharacterized protein YndB with AHSA1/START domain